MKLAELKKLQTEVFIQDYRDYGWPSEFTRSHNRISRGIIRAMLKENGEAWLWNVNPYGDSEVVVRKYEKGMVYNFGASFVTPGYDPRLEQMIIDRLAAEYTGTKDDYTRVDAIMSRAEEVGAAQLIWS